MRQRERYVGESKSGRFERGGFGERSLEREVVSREREVILRDNSFRERSFEKERRILEIEIVCNNYSKLTTSSNAD